MFDLYNVGVFMYPPPPPHMIGQLTLQEADWVRGGEGGRYNVCRVPDCLAVLTCKSLLGSLPRRLYRSAPDYGIRL